MRLFSARLSSGLRDLSSRLSSTHVGSALRKGYDRFVQVVTVEKLLPKNMQPRDGKIWADFDVSNAEGDSLMTARPTDRDNSPLSYSHGIEDCTLDELQQVLVDDVSRGGYLFTSLAQSRPETLGRRLQDMEEEQLYSLMRSYSQVNVSRAPEETRAVMKLVLKYLPDGITKGQEDKKVHFDALDTAMQFCGSNTSPEGMAAMLQEKHQTRGLSMGELAATPTPVMTDIAFELADAQAEDVTPPWFEQWLGRKDELLGDTPAGALLGPELPPSNNAYAINNMALIDAARNNNDEQMELACKVLDHMLCMGLPVFNVNNEAAEKVIAVNDGDLFRELQRVSLKEVAVLVSDDQEASARLLKDLGWKPLQRTGDEGRKVMIVREFLGQYFSASQS